MRRKLHLPLEQRGDIAVLATFGLVAIATAAAAAAAATAAANTNREAYAHPIPGAFIIVAKYPVLVVSTAKLVATAAVTTAATAIERRCGIAKLAAFSRPVAQRDDGTRPVRSLVSLA